MTFTELLTNPGVTLLGMLMATLLLSYAANYWLARIFMGKLYRYIVAPGVIVHEYSHLLGCLLTGARIREVRVFDERGGRVVHEEPRLAFGEGIISVAPIFGAALVVYLLARLLMPSFVGFGELEIGSWQFLVFAYLAGSIVATMAPSKQDLKVGLVSFLVLCAIIGLASVNERLSNYFGFLLGGFYDQARYVVAFSLVVLGVLAATSGIAYLLLHRTIRKGVQYRSLE